MFECAVKQFSVKGHRRRAALLLVSVGLFAAACSEEIPEGATSAAEMEHQTNKLVDQRTVFGGNEPHIAVDPTDTQNIAIAQFVSVQLSTDGGNTFPTTLNVPAPAGYNFGRGGDPVLAYDSQGNLFFTFLAQAAGTSSIDVFIQQIDHANGVFVGGAVNVSQAAGFGVAAGSNNDKQWIAIDRFAGSPFTDRKYIVWTDFGGPNVSVLASFSDDGVNWSAGQTLSLAAEGFPWPPHIAVAANGDVYAAYHGNANGEIILLRSPFDSATNSGGNFDLTTRTSVFPAGAANITFNDQRGTRLLSGSQSWTQGAAQPYILPDPTNANNVLIIAADDPTDANDGAGFDDMAVFMVRSTNRGGIWSAPVQVDQGPGNSHQLFPTGAFDLDSQCVSIAYYDSRAGAVNAAGNFLLDVFVRTSEDGGTTWNPEVQINDTAFDPDMLAPDRFPPSNTFRIGEYIGLLSARGAAWTGNDPTDPAGAQSQQIIFDYSDGVPPTVTAPVNIVTDQCTPIDVGAPTANDDVCGIGVDTVVGVATDPNGVSFNVSVGSPTAFIPGVTTIVWSAVDGADNVSVPDGNAVQTVTVNDIEPPVFDAVPADQLFTRCDFSDTSVSLTPPTATDNCTDASAVTVTGRIIASSNPAVVVPLDFEGGMLNLPIGTYTIEWTAEDSVGNQAVVEQVVSIQAGLLATESLYVRNNSDVTGDLANSGGGVTVIENDVTTGDIMSVPDVTVGHRSHLGNVYTEGDILYENTADAPTFVSQNPGTDVVLTAPLDISGVVFPPASGPIALNTAVPAAPGSYIATVVNSGNVLRLQAGVYYFAALTLNAASTVIAEEGTVIYVGGGGHFQSKFVDASNNLVNVFVGHFGNTVQLSADFTGTLVAPNAYVNIGTGGAMHFTGVIHARVIDIRNNADFACVQLPCAADACGTPVDPVDPTCDDGIQNGDEEGVDCGGPVCGACPTCDDGIQNGDEEGIDCGGPVCAPCGAPALTASVPTFNDWGSGYCVTVNVTNNGTAPTSSWSVTFNMFAATTYTSWNGNFTGNSGVVTVTPVGWNNVINPGQTISSVGFCANRAPGGNAVPVVLNAQGF